jgi:hypothetical protein
MAITVVIQKTKNVEPVGPVQHFIFKNIVIVYDKGCGC